MKSFDSYCFLYSKKYCGQKELSFNINCVFHFSAPIVSPIVTAKTDGPGTLIVTWDVSTNIYTDYSVHCDFQLIRKQLVFFLPIAS